MLKAAADLVFGIGAYIINLGLGEADQRRWLHKEFMAYAYSHLRLMHLGFVRSPWSGDSSCSGARAASLGSAS